MPTPCRSFATLALACAAVLTGAAPSRAELIAFEFALGPPPSVSGGTATFPVGITALGAPGDTVEMIQLSVAGG